MAICVPTAEDMEVDRSPLDPTKVKVNDLVFLKFDSDENDEMEHDQNEYRYMLCIKAFMLQSTNDGMHHGFTSITCQWLIHIVVPSSAGKRACSQAQKLAISSRCSLRTDHRATNA